MVVALREGDDARLKLLHRVADPAPILSPTRLDFIRWIAAESLSSVGSTSAALLPPPLTDSQGGGLAGDAFAGNDTRTAPPASSPPSRPAQRPALLIGAGREQRVLDHIEVAKGGALVIAADVDAAARWAQRLAKLDRVVRLDSGVDEAARAQAWRQLADGSARLATGTRSALLAPVPPPGTLVLLDEHEVAHKPPGPPRIHSREVVLERATRESLTLLLTSATPSTEMWWRASGGRADAAPAPPGPWPAVSLADTRTVLRREPLTPALARAARDTLGLAGFVSADQLLRVPDFRAGERTFALLWAAAERVGAGGALVIQSQNPTHYAFDAVVRQDLAAFYAHELRFREELGYPPFRRLAIVTVRGANAPETERLAVRVGAALRASTPLHVYPPGADRRNRIRRIVVKGPAELPSLVGAALEEFRRPRREGRGIIGVEVDPVEWPF